MNRVQKATALLFCLLLMVFSLIGCSSSDETTKDTQSVVKVEQKDEKISTNDSSKVQQTNKVENTAAVNESEEKKSQPPAADTTKTAQNTETSNSKSAAKNANTNDSTNTIKKSTISSDSQKTSTTTTTDSNSKTETTTAAKSTTAKKTTTNTTTSKSKPPVTTQQQATKATISIVGPKDRGTILASSKVSIKDGDTIYSVILQAAQQQGIVVDARGSGATAYIEGIDNIYEFDYGAKSGWVFKHNGVSITKSIGVIKVKDGDRIECFYTE